MRPAVLTCTALILGCGGEPDRPGAAPKAVEESLPDSLALTTPQGVEVWYTAVRPGTSATGTPCTDRTLEIRRDGKRIPVPLLYTGSPPELVNDTTIRARLSNRCEPADAYLVDLRTGQPVRER